MINKEQFERYERVRLSGRTNMMDITRVKDLSGLTRKEVLEIMSNYDKLKEQFEKGGVSIRHLNTSMMDEIL